MAMMKKKYVADKKADRMEDAKSGIRNLPRTLHILVQLKRCIQYIALIRVKTWNQRH